MLPSETINTKFNTSVTLNASRAYTFIDSYIYMKNSNYNALYEKNKEILAIEKQAVEKENADALYFALTEQTKSLDSVIIRIRNYTQNIRNDVVSNLLLIIPEIDIINEFSEAISMCAMLPKQKIVKYEISPIEYPNMAVFYNLFNQEIKEFIALNDETANINNPFVHNVATKFLTQSGKDFSFSNTDILSNEKFLITTIPRLRQIMDYFRKKSRIILLINKDFRTFYFYLRRFRILQNIMDAMKPTVMNDGRILVGNNSKPLKSFSDYLILYKHYSMMIKYMMDVISNYDSKFFNKIYALQSNIEVYRSIINDTISYYKTTMRNNEATEIDAMIGGPDIANSLLQDEVNEIDIEPPEDTIKGIEVPQSDVEYPEDIFEYEIDIDNEKYVTPPEISEVESAERNISGAASYLENTLNNMYTTDYEINDANYLFESIDIKDLFNKKKTALLESAITSDRVKKAIALMSESIKNSNAKFIETSKDLRTDNAGLIQDADNISLTDIDLSGISFDMFKYEKGFNEMQNIRIPSFNEQDVILLTENDGVGYKEKYFPDLYYFKYNGCPLNKNKFRGSQAKVYIAENQVKNTFEFFLNYIKNYKNITKKITAANLKILSSLASSSNKVDDSYGTTEAIAESVLFNRLSNKDDIYDILLETSELKDKKIINTDIVPSKDANEAKDLSDAIRIYSKICYEINSARMDIYEEIFETASRFIKMIISSVKTITAK